MVDTHMRLRGPYSGVDSLLRQVVPGVYAQKPELVTKHVVEIVSIAPELRSLITNGRETLTSLAIPKERTRFYSAARTLRLAHGLVDFLKSCLAEGIFERLALHFENMHAAEELDSEFVAVLLRRTEPQYLQVVVSTATGDLANQTLLKALGTYTERVELPIPDQEERQRRLVALEIPGNWHAWLQEKSAGWLGEWEQLGQARDLLATQEPTGETFLDGLSLLLQNAPVEWRERWAKAYVASDGTGEGWLEQEGYACQEEETRRLWHDERAAALESLDEWSLHLGAIPYHREQGQDPAGKGAEALEAALDYCIDMGYYEATIRLAHRGRQVIDWEKQLTFYWTFTTKATTSLAALNRPEEAEEFYNEARALSHAPLLHMQAAYATAMLYTRHHKEKKNHKQAKAWINEAIAIATLLPDLKERAFNTVFNKNGLALIEMHLGHSQEALRLVTEGLERLDKELEPGEHLLHRSVLLYNRAQVYAGTGQLEEALADYNAVIEQDPHYSEYYFDRGNLYRRLDRVEEALADYEKAILYSPPYVEAYYNRAGTLSLLKREDEALASYNYVLELDPDYLDALINRASVLYERGEYTVARQDVNHGLSLGPDNAQLLCTLGLLELAEEHVDAALQAFNMALAQDPTLMEAWTNRAIVRFEQRDFAGSISDLTQALTLGANATALYNRGFAYQAQEEWEAALADYTHALELDYEDTQDLLYQRGLCYWHAGQIDLARQDFQAHLGLGASPHIEGLAHMGVH
jgi:tetratricopeptide (TPR) repeat protein